LQWDDVTFKGSQPTLASSAAILILLSLMQDIYHTGHLHIAKNTAYISHRFQLIITGSRDLTYHEGQYHAPVETYLHEYKQPSICTQQHSLLANGISTTCD